MSLLKVPNGQGEIRVSLKTFQINSQLCCHCHCSNLINISFSGKSGAKSRCSRNAIPSNFPLRFSLCVFSLPSIFRVPWKQKYCLHSNEVFLILIAWILIIKRIKDRDWTWQDGVERSFRNVDHDHNIVRLWHSYCIPAKMTLGHWKFNSVTS